MFSICNCCYRTNKHNKVLVTFLFVLLLFYLFKHIIQQRLGKGSFGTVYIVKDTKTVAEGAERDETVHATQEAQLLSHLNHPAILKFYTRILETDNKDLDLHYIHQRRILHRDLKAKNIFLRKNIVKIETRSLKNCTWSATSDSFDRTQEKPDEHCFYTVFSITVH
uniref:non-specific serine/threonine protein kinase n=1 Tax=Cyprinus carpio TaxID=7962 RepID=A0A8C1GX84_CYPCA